MNHSLLQNANNREGTPADHNVPSEGRSQWSPSFQKVAPSSTIPPLSSPPTTPFKNTTTTAVCRQPSSTPSSLVTPPKLPQRKASKHEEENNVVPSLGPPPFSPLKKRQYDSIRLANVAQEPPVRHRMPNAINNLPLGQDSAVTPSRRRQRQAGLVHPYHNNINNNTPPSWQAPTSNRTTPPASNRTTPSSMLHKEVWLWGRQDSVASGLTMEDSVVRNLGDVRQGTEPYYRRTLKTNNARQQQQQRSSNAYRPPPSIQDMAASEGVPLASKDRVGMPPPPPPPPIELASPPLETAAKKPKTAVTMTESATHQQTVQRDPLVVGSPTILAASPATARHKTSNPRKDAPAQQQYKARPSDEKAAARASALGRKVTPRSPPNRPSDEKAAGRLVGAYPVATPRPPANRSPPAPVPSRPSDEKAAARVGAFSVATPRPPANHSPQGGLPSRPSDEKAAARVGAHAVATPRPPANRSPQAGIPSRPSDEKAAARVGAYSVSTPRPPANHSPPAGLSGRPSDEKAAARVGAFSVATPRPPANHSPQGGLSGRPSDEKAAARIGAFSVTSPPTTPSPGRRGGGVSTPSSRPSDEKAAARLELAAARSSVPQRSTSVTTPPRPGLARPSDEKAAYRRSTPNLTIVEQQETPPKGIGIAPRPPPANSSHRLTPPRPSDSKQGMRVLSKTGVVAVARTPPRGGLEHAPRSFRIQDPDANMGEQTKAASYSTRESKSLDSTGWYDDEEEEEIVSLNSHSHSTTRTGNLIRDSSVASLGSGLDLDDHVRNSIIQASNATAQERRWSEAMQNHHKVASASVRSLGSTESEEIASLGTALDSHVGDANKNGHAFGEDDEAIKAKNRLAPPALQRSQSAGTLDSGLDLNDTLRNAIIRRSHAAAQRRRSSVEQEILQAHRRANSRDSELGDVKDLLSTEDKIIKKNSMQMSADMPMEEAQMGIPLETSTQEEEGAGENELTNMMEVQAGLPVLLPGAFAIEGVESTSHRSGDGQRAGVGYDSEFEEEDSQAGGGEEAVEAGVEVAEAPQRAISELTSPHQLNEDPEAAPLEAQLYEEAPSVEGVDANVLDETDEKKHKQRIRRRIRLIQCVAAMLCVVVIVSIVIGVTVPSRKTKTTQLSADGCVVVQEWFDSSGSVFGPTEDDNIQFGFSVSLSGDGGRLAVGSPGLDLDRVTSKSGGVTLMDYNGTGWTEIASLQGPGKDALAGSQVVLSSDGGRVAIGAPGWNGGSVLVYDGVNQDAGTWTLSATLANPEELGDNSKFGAAVAMSGDGKRIVVGDRESGGNVGRIRVYQDRGGGDWVLLGSAISGEQGSDFFGWSVAISTDGQRVAAAARGANSFTGIVRIYEWTGSSWRRIGELEGSQERENFGASLDLSADGSVLAVGAIGHKPQEDSFGVGRVTIFEYKVGGSGSSSAAWEEMGESLVGDADFDSFGFSVALSGAGDIVAIGSPENDRCGTDSGKIDLLKYDGKKWSRIGTSVGDEAINEGGQYGFSTALSLDGLRVVGGAPSTTFNGLLGDVGKIRTFDSENDE